jgi:response regulator RpfG family c-di-GMP phosphodiesterase
MLSILQNFLANQKYSDAHAYRIAMCATRVAETVGLDPGSVEDIRTAALLFNLQELGVSIDVISKAAQGTQEDLRHAHSGSSKLISKAGMGGSLRRAIPIYLCERQLRLDGDGIGVSDASFEVQILMLAEEYEGLISGNGGAKLAPSQAGKEVVRRFASRSDSLVVDAFSKAFGGEAAGAGA